MTGNGYPRPDRERRHWLSLDGEWEFEFCPDATHGREHTSGGRLGRTILVPFCVESDAGGIAMNEPPPVFRYARTFNRSDLPRGKRFFLSFGAVDHEAMVWLNGAFLGSHRGGYTPFSFEITDQIADVNRLIVEARDPRSRKTLRGKQYLWKGLSPIFYTPASGIWQPVHIYAAGTVRIEALWISTDMNSISVSWSIDGGRSMVIEAADADGSVVACNEIDSPGKTGCSTMTILKPRCWSPHDPYLYSVTVRLYDSAGESDRISSSAGLRLIEARNGRIYLNDKTIFLKMLLLQGYYPYGHYTPADGAAGYERDILLIKRMGFNGIRIHQKIEDPRFLDLCDRHGLLVWMEMPSPFLFSFISEEEFEHELREMLDRDSGHASAMAVVLFNETWGVFDLLWRGRRKRYIRELYARVKERYPRLLVVDNSGYDHVLTDIADIHHYLADDRAIRKLYGSLGDRKRMTMRFFKIPRAAAYLVLTHLIARRPYLSGGNYRGGEPFIISEFGGAGFYKSGKGILESFADNVRIMREYPAIAGYCLTQAYDVEQEQNGLLTFDRKPKYPIEEIARINSIYPD